MRIGNFSLKTGEMQPLNKWLWCIEILRCSPSRYPRHIFKPYIFICFTKFIEYGEPYKLNGKEDIKKGDWKYWESPIGLYWEIKIIK